jgi:hypothetical protein
VAAGRIAGRRVWEYNPASQPSAGGSILEVQWRKINLEEATVAFTLDEATGRLDAHVDQPDSRNLDPNHVELRMPEPHKPVPRDQHLWIAG